jgi:hypothetical protein
VPVILGGGTWLFAELGTTPVQFEGPVAVVEGTGGHTPALPGQEVGIRQPGAD